MSLSPEDIGDILGILDSTSYDELELATNRIVLRLRREPGGWTMEHEARAEPRLLAGQHPAHPATAEGTAGEAAGEGTAGEADAPREGLHAVRAPLPGVFYRAPKPGEPPFVEVGDHAGAETVVAVLETMKLMNPVRAGASGTVEEIRVANGESAEQGAVLMWIAPDATG